MRYSDSGMLQEGRWFAYYSNSTINASINHQVVLYNTILACYSSKLKCCFLGAIKKKKKKKKGLTIRIFENW